VGVHQRDDAVHAPSTAARRLTEHHEASNPAPLYCFGAPDESPPGGWLGLQASGFPSSREVHVPLI
jgi:hypothetical protein